MSTSKRGFASMTPEDRRKIASMGGKASHAKGVAHTWNSETARAAGRKSHSGASRRTVIGSVAAPGLDPTDIQG